ncbi:MAG TPA: signal peptidase I [Armatimonadota bacterium]|nr:signal peptidase I [Armatimonadota bacterium]
MERRFTAGNAARDGDRYRGWLIGHFVEGDPLRRREDVEVKWLFHPAGDREPRGWVANRSATSLSILVHGEFRIGLRTDGEERSLHLTAPGDYALWEPGVEHTWEALTDAVVLTIRTPSRPHDQHP